MHVQTKYHKLKSEFGAFLRQERIKANLSPYDLAYILGTCHAMPYYWESGQCFPRSIILLQKLRVLFPRTPQVVSGILKKLSSHISPQRWKRMRRELKNKRGYSSSVLCKCPVPSKDIRYDRYLAAFGKYLGENRKQRGVNRSTISKALGVEYYTYTAWEAGHQFPSNMDALAILNRLYGDTVLVMFGICKNKDIHISREEVREVINRRQQFRGSKIWEKGKPKPPTWGKYIEARLKKMGKNSKK